MNLATDDDMKIHIESSGKKSFCIKAETLHDENHLHIVTPVTYLSQQRYDTINCQRYGYNIDNKLPGVA